MSKYLKTSRSHIQNKMGTGNLLPTAYSSGYLFVVCACRAVPCRAVLRPVFRCDVMRGQVPVVAAIGDSFPATALSLLPRKGVSEVSGQADGEGKARKEKISKWEDSQSARQTCNPGLYPPPPRPPSPHYNILPKIFSAQPWSSHPSFLHFVCSADFPVTVSDHFNLRPSACTHLCVYVCD